MKNLLIYLLRLYEDERMHAKREALVQVQDVPVARLVLQYRLLDCDLMPDLGLLERAPVFAFGVVRDVHGALRAATDLAFQLVVEAVAGQLCLGFGYGLLRLHG